MLRAPFPDANKDYRNAQCDSCRGRIGGPRLFCLDCDIKNSESYNTLDLCSAPQCVDASVTREDLEKAHEPNHRLVKVRTSVLTRSHGRVHTAACDAFGRVRETCRKIAESALNSGEETNRMCKKLQVLNQPRQGYPLRATSQMTGLILQMVLKMELRSRVRLHEMQDGVKTRTKACPHVANAMVLSPSLSGTAFFVKVSLRRIKLVTHY